jgi:para-aminobenzoate synthetase/4-amino-4-deoxychorismate lyase
VAHWTGLPEEARAAVAAETGAILLETSRFDPSNQHSYLFLHPVDTIVAHTPGELPQVFARIESALRQGFHVAGFFSYECGTHFGRSGGGSVEAGELPLAWLGVYRKPFVFDHAQGRFEGPAPEPFPKLPAATGTDITPESIALEIAPAEYSDRILRIKEYIAAGDTYQVNFTDRVSFPVQARPSALYAALSRQQSVAYGAFLNVAGHHILSFSPELFFRMDGGRIVTRPMKGTMARGLDAVEDRQASLRLQNDEKNRAEHVMIVDLLRNDLGRICQTGSVVVEDLFSVEKYETLLQMTSSIAGQMRPGVSYYEIFRSMFPCGSITGAPKLRTMEIIRELEQRPRGVYSGAIGFISPGGSAVFNVAIRTLTMKDGLAFMGVGGGIVADSDPHDEYRECQLKAAFLTRARPEFQLIETMLWEKEFRLLPLHLDRLEASADYFDFGFDRETVVERLSALSASFEDETRQRVRLLLGAKGEITLSHSELQTESYSVRVKLSEQTTSSTDIFLRHKTTQREFYNRELAAARAEGFDEALFTNEKGEVTEGAISNLFIERAGKFLTPPLVCGLLPGVYRRQLLETRTNAEECILTLADLQTADAVYLCNSVLGLRAVKVPLFQAVGR